MRQQRESGRTSITVTRVAATKERLSVHSSGSLVVPKRRRVEPADLGSRHPFPEGAFFRGSLEDVAKSIHSLPEVGRDCLESVAPTLA